VEEGRFIKKSFQIEGIKLVGEAVSLEPLRLEHAGALARAAAGNRELYRWSPVPQDEESARIYVRTALEWQTAGTAVPFAIVRVGDGEVIGSTRFWNIERWAWAEGHPLYGRATPDACEIGYTWLAGTAVRTAANTEAKLLMLTHVFEEWEVFRVCLHTDVRNARSRAAMERMGAKFEGVLRAHRMAADFVPRDSARYSIVAEEWPEVKRGLEERLRRRG
jgi:RimJ/RimL family protein N-acetyltransferase